MKNIIFQFCLFLFLTCSFHTQLFCQCDYFEDFSNPSGWTQVGTLVEINNGELQYVNGAPDGVQRRVYKQLATPIANSDNWTASFKFYPIDVGTSDGQPHTAHLLFTLSETEQNPIWDCPDIPCSGWPNGTQDAISVIYLTENDPDGTIFFRIVVRYGGVRYDSPSLVYSSLGQDIYVVLTKGSSNYTLDIYSDVNQQNPLGNGPVSLSLFDLADLNFIQHGNFAGGFYLRELTGSVDDVCIELSEPCMTTYGTFTHQGCQGDGTSFNLGGTVFNENNPSGTAILINQAGCDSIVSVNLVFNPGSEGAVYYEGCEGDGYEIEVNGTLYWEGNPSGEEIMTNINGCDSVVTVNLIYFPATSSEITYHGCEGDGYEIEVNGTIYWEGNPSGEEIMTNVKGCDSIVTVNLLYFPATSSEIIYQGCESDGYEIEVNGTLYWEGNPSGEEIMTNVKGCDSIVTVNLIYFPATSSEITYQGCEGDGYEIEVNETIYWEGNPSGEEIMTNVNGCDSVIQVMLIFSPPSYKNINYTGCIGDGHTEVVNGTVYSESNTTGTEIIENSVGCDSIIIVNLIFNENYVSNIDYYGCSGDGYSIVVNGTTYNEANPAGTEIVESQTGCDSIININLLFNENMLTEIMYEGCSGDGYSIIVNGTNYNEENPTGIEIIENENECDSLINVNLIFYPISSSSISYSGCQGDGYFIAVNGTIYNENNPNGTEIMNNSNGCDSVITIVLLFQENSIDTLNYTGVVGDGYSIQVNGIIYNEKNPKGIEIMQASNGCDSIIYVILVFEKENDIDLISTNREVNVYPNPTNGPLTFSGISEITTSPVYTIKIFNHLGILYDEIVFKDFNFTLDLNSMLPSGIYFIRITDKTSEVDKIIKVVLTE